MILNDLIRKNVAKGYTCALAPADNFALISGCEPVRAGAVDVVSVFCPTYVSRFDDEAFRQTVIRIREQISDIGRNNWLRLYVIIGIQYEGSERSTAVARIKEAEALFAEEQCGLVGYVVEGKSKVRALNLAIKMAGELHTKGLLLIDDDVLFDRYCFLNLIKSLKKKNFVGSVGAAKVPITKDGKASKMFFKIKRYRQSPHQYPHACCMIVQYTEIAQGIPLRYVSDDGYLCFKFLDGKVVDQMWKISIEPTALCYYHVGGPFWQTLRRVRRQTLNRCVLMADFPQEVSRFFYEKNILFGIWPLQQWDNSAGVVKGVYKWLIRSGLYLWFLYCWFELFFRGLLNSPLRQIKWNAYSNYEVPAVEMNK